MKYILILFFVPIFSNAQEAEFEKPDFSKIAENIKEEGNFFYDSLMERYRNGDSTLTIKEKRHLYYGFSFQKNYSPYGRSKFTDSIRVLTKKNELIDTELNTLVRFADSVLITRPFDTDAISVQLYAFEQLEDKENFNKKIAQYRMIFDALFSTGDGTTKENAIHVLYTSHEYEILKIYGYQYMSQTLIGSYDYLKVRDNDEGYEGFYFEISSLFNSMAKMFDKDD